MRVTGSSTMAILLAIGLVGCGTSGPAKVVVGPSTGLNGNWLLVGTLPFASSLDQDNQPFALSITLAVLGDHIVGGATDHFNCSKLLSGIRGAATESGTIAVDGSFSMLSEARPEGPGDSLQVKGSVPLAGASTWTGSYVFASSNPACPATSSGPFTAVRVADLTGTFTTAMPVSLNPVKLGAPVVPVTMQFTLQQGGLLPGLPVNAPELLSGSVQIEGTSCFKSGVTTMSPNSAVLGTELLISYVLDDGSAMTVLGDIEDVGTTRLTVQGVFFGGGSCGLLNAGPIELIRR